MARVVIYTRVSSDKQERENDSLPAQEKDCRDYCDQKGWTAVGVCSDTYTGHDSLNDRKGMLDAIAMIQRGEADTFLVRRINRTGRDIVDNLLIHRDVYEAGGTFCSVEDGLIPNTPMGKLMFTVQSFQAEQDWHNIVAQTQAGIQNRVARGRILPSVPLYGYRHVDSATSEKYHNKATYAIDEETAQTVRDIYAKADAGWSVNRIATWLNENHIPTHSQLLARRGQLGERRLTDKWAEPRLRELLMNPSYCGRHAAFRNATKHMRIQGEDGTMRTTVRYRPREDGVVPISIPAIVDEAQWQRVQERLKERQRGPSSEVGVLLSGGFAVCGMCDARMNTAKHPKGGYRCYVCMLRSGNPNHKAPVCPGRAFSVRASEVDADVWAKVKAIIRDEPRFLRLIQSKEDKQAGLEAEAVRQQERVAREVADTKARQALIYDRMLTEADDTIRAMHRLELQRINETLAKLEERAEEAEADLLSVAKRHDAPRVLRVFANYAMQPRYAFVFDSGEDPLDTLTREEKRVILRALEVKVKFYPVKSDFAQTHEHRWDFTFTDGVALPEVSGQLWDNRLLSRAGGVTGRALGTRAQTHIRHT